MWLHWDTLFSKRCVIAPSGINQNYLSQTVCLRGHFSSPSWAAAQTLWGSGYTERRQRCSNGGDVEMVKKALMPEKNVEMHPIRKQCRGCVRAGTRGAFLLPENPKLAPRAASFSINFTFWLFCMKKWRTPPQRALSAAPGCPIFL